MVLMEVIHVWSWSRGIIDHGVFALLFIGPKKLPELARGLGKSLREFQRAKNDLQQEIDLDVDDLKEINDPMMTVEDESFTAHHDELPSNTEVKHGKGKKKKNKQRSS
jgi:TatA/E family protein of Tat protein translocase